MKKIVLAFMCFVLLASCTDRAKEHVGLVRVGPNENMIKTNPPLIIPPDFTVTPIKE